MTLANRTESKTPEQLVQAYDRIIALARDSFDKIKTEGGPIIQSLVDVAKDKAVELGDLTREEASKIGNYIIRDLHDIADYLDKQQSELAVWLVCDLENAEKRVVDKISPLIEQAKLELAHLAKTATKVSEWRTGEIRGIGVLQCAGCGQTLHFDKTSHIPPCPKCHGTLFKRVSG